MSDKKPRIGDRVTSVEELEALEVGTIVDTGLARRERTHPSDEWDMVLDSEEVLDEGLGSVTIVFLGGEHA